MADSYEKRLCNPAFAACEALDHSNKNILMHTKPCGTSEVSRGDLEYIYTIYHQPVLNGLSFCFVKFKSVTFVTDLGGCIYCFKRGYIFEDKMLGTSKK